MPLQEHIRVGLGLREPTTIYRHDNCCNIIALIASRHLLTVSCLEEIGSDPELKSWHVG
jgi:hypothetical protein